MKDWSRALQNITMVGQLGLSLVMPVLMCLAVCYLLTSNLGCGAWIYIPGFILGLGASFMTAYKVYLSEERRNRKDGEHKPTAFNRHY